MYTLFFCPVYKPAVIQVPVRPTEVQHLWGISAGTKTWTKTYTSSCTQFELLYCNSPAAFSIAHPVHVLKNRVSFFKTRRAQSLETKQMIWQIALSGCSICFVHVLKQSTYQCQVPHYLVVFGPICSFAWFGAFSFTLLYS